MADRQAVARVIRWAFNGVAAVGFTAASLWSVRLACADYWYGRQSVRAIEKAIGFMPGRADYYVRLASLESPSNGQLTERALQRAVALNPGDAGSWIELGLQYERRGAQPLAEQCLLRAAGEDKQYLPRWTLANYYFRQHALDHFWFWAGEAARAPNGDLAPLFRLCGKVTEDGKLIDRLNIQGQDIRAAYLSYLVSEKKFDLVQPAVRHLVHDIRVADVPLLLSICDRMVESGNESNALDIWNRLADDRKIPFTRLQQAEGRVLTNGDFRTAPISRGFDWRLPSIDGAAASLDEGGGLRLNFSGRQPEECVLLVQYVPTLEKRNYELRFEYRTFGITAHTGLAWRIICDGTLLGAHELSEHETAGRVSFTTPPASRGIQLVLAYNRVRGTTRIEGSLVLRRVELTPTRYDATGGAFTY